MTKDQATKRTLIVKEVGITAGSKGGSIYPENCHYTDGFRIDYSFPNCSTAGDWQVCQDTMDLMTRRFNCHDELVEALRKIVSCDTMLEEKIMWAKQALSKAQGDE